MPRDVRGRPVKSEAAEPIRYGASGDKDSKPKMARSAEDPDDMIRDHHDRLARIEEHLGMAKPRDGFKDENQGGKIKAGAGHVTEKGGKVYERRRH